MSDRFDPKQPKDTPQPAQESGDGKAGKISFNDVHDGKVEATRPGESTIDKIERGIAATAKELAQSLASIGEKFNSLAQLPEDHEHHPNQALKQYEGSESHKQLLAAATGKVSPSEITKNFSA